MDVAGSNTVAAAAAAAPDTPKGPNLTTTPTAVAHALDASASLQRRRRPASFLWAEWVTSDRPRPWMMCG